MRLPNLDSALSPIHIPGNLADYIDSLAPFHHHSNTIAVFDAKAKLLFQNEACRYFLEVGKSSIDTLYSDDKLHESEPFKQQLDTCLTTGGCQTIDLPIYFDRNICVDLNLIFRPILTNEGLVVGCVLTLGEESISYNKHHLSNLQEKIKEYRNQISNITSQKVKSDHLLRALLTGTPFPVMLFNSKRQVLQINRACENLLGISSRQAMATSCDQYIDCYQKHGVCPILDNHHEINSEEDQCLISNGNNPHILRSAVLLSEDGEPIILEAFIDITDRVLAEKQLKQLHEHNRLLLESTSEGIFGIDVNLNFTFVNNAAADMLGYQQEELLGCDVHKLIHYADDKSKPLAREQLAISKTIENSEKLDMDSIFWLKNGSSIPVRYSSSPVFEDGKLTGAVIVFHNVAEERALHKKMEYLASHDTLTGLINRNDFERQIKKQIKKCQESHEKAALCYIDLDQFKLVNDTCGHAAGDALLRQLTNVVHHSMKSQDTLARLGGDEFGVLFRNCDIDTAMNLTQDICKTIEEFRFIWEGKSFSVKASAGLVAIDENIEDGDKLLSAADSACYIAKDKGRNTVHLYQFHDEAIAKRHNEMIWVSRINEALSHNEFELFFQPIFRESTEFCHFIEFLVRLKQKGKTEKDKFILPGTFIPAAERYNLMSSIDRWVTNSALEWMIKNSGRFPQLDICAINLSGQTIGNPKFAKFIEEKLKAHPHIAKKLCFEITETAAVADLKQAIEFIEFLKKFGCRFALDDFGSGMSSFSYLKNLPVDFLKIDGTFVRDMAIDRVDYAMVEAINQIGQVMGIQTIAEYVESNAIQEKLRNLGVDYMQGNSIFKAEPLSNFSIKCSNLNKMISS